MFISQEPVPVVQQNKFISWRGRGFTYKSYLDKLVDNLKGKYKGFELFKENVDYDYMNHYKETVYLYDYDGKGSISFSYWLSTPKSSNDFRYFSLHYSSLTPEEERERLFGDNVDDL